MLVYVRGLVRNKVLTYTSRDTTSGFANVIGITSSRSKFIHQVEQRPRGTKRPCGTTLTNRTDYYTLNSLTVFELAESVQWIFEISACPVITTNYTIIMSTTLKVTGNHVLCVRSAWFLRVIMSTSRNSCCLPSVKKQKHDFQIFCVQCIMKQLLDLAFVISRVINVSVRVISLSLRLQLITLTSPLIVLDITKISSNN